MYLYYGGRLSTLQGQHQKSAILKWKALLSWLVFAERKDLVLIFVFGVLFSIFSLVVPIGVQTLVNTFLFTGLLQPILVLLSAIAVGLILAAIFRMSQIHLIEILQRRLMVRIAYEIGRKIKRADSKFLHQENGTELVNRTFEVEKLQKSVSSLLTEALALLIQSVVGFALLSAYHLFLFVFCLIFAMGLYAVLVPLGASALHRNIKNSTAKHELVAWLESLISKKHLLNHSSAESWADSKIHSFISKYIQTRENFFILLFYQLIGLHGLQVISSVGLLGVGGYLVVQNQLSVGQLIAAELIVTSILFSVTKLQKQLEDFYDLSSSLEKINQLLEVPIEGARFAVCGRTVRAGSWFVDFAEWISIYARAKGSAVSCEMYSF
jgi:putative ABC transport system ATP-binding protein